MKLRHLISVDNLDRKRIDFLFGRATYYQENYRKDNHKPLCGKRLLSIFCEPSTRTRFSFEAAMDQLGGTILNAQDAMTSSSFAKDESIEDGIKVISKYGDIIVLRHREAGSMQRAASVCDIPFINAGEGKGEHPTQTLLDLYTISRNLHRIDGITIGMAGDLVNGRTIHSLTKALAQHYAKIKVAFIAPVQLSIPNDIRARLEDCQVEYSEYQNLTTAPMEELDCLYMTRLQKERFDDQRDYESVKDCCILRPEFVNRMKKEAIILHPLPRVNEIPRSIDEDLRAKYFVQAENGLYVRMALLEHMLS